MNWCAILDPSHYGHLVRWFATRRNKPVIEFAQIPELRIGGSDSIVVRFEKQYAAEIIVLAAAIVHDDGTSCLIEFHRGLVHGEEADVDTRRSNVYGAETTSRGTH